jgi:hypothetical protein
VIAAGLWIDSWVGRFGRTMARTIKRLHSVDRITKPGMHPDGGGLYLQITPSGARSWVYRYMIGSKERYMGLGPLARVTLKAAREMADECFRRARIYDSDGGQDRRDDRRHPG